MSTSTRGARASSRAGGRGAGGGRDAAAAARRGRRAIAARVAPGDRARAREAIDLDAIDVPRDLVQIRAYVRWEEAGKPEDTSADWRALEFERAREDLRRECARGTTLNEIRRRYGQPEVPGDDVVVLDRGYGESAREAENARGEAEGGESMETLAAPEVAETRASAPAPVSNRRERDIRAMLPRRTDPSAEGERSAKAEAPSTVARWREATSDAEGWTLISDSTSPLADGELLVQVFESSGRDEEAMSAPRRKIVGRRVVLTTNALEPLVCHWGAAKIEPGEWALPPESVRPPGSVEVGPIACETPMEDFTGCFPLSMSGSVDEEGFGECAFMQRLVFDLPGDGPNELMGLSFVFRNVGGSSWFKDSSNGNSNYRVSCTRPTEHKSTASDELIDTITRAEAGGNWWSLMHRFNLATSLLEKHCVKAESESKAREAAAKIFVWLRYSATRQLTWQRNYNVKPRELSSAQSRLTHCLAEIYTSQPHLRDMARLMLSTVGRGGESGQGQQIRDEILNIMHRNGIKEVKGIWMEEWHQKLHNNTTPDDIVICEAYLAFLQANGDLSAYWRVLDEGGVSRERLESFERPVRSEPIWRPQIKDNLIRDFKNYLKILKAVHGGADLTQSFNVCRDRLSNDCQRALEYICANQGGADVFNLVNACLEARHGVRDAGLAEPSDTPWCRELIYLDLAIADVSNRAIQGGSDAVTDTQGLLTLTDMVLEDLCLSLPSSNDDLLYSLINWRRILELQRSGDSEWALRAKATVDRIRLALTEHATEIHDAMQPAASTIGKRCDCDKWTIDLFSEEVIRGGPAFALSLMLTRLDPYLRREANMGEWQIISPATCVGEVLHVKTLAEVMNNSFSTPTVLVCDHVGGDEEIPKGATAVLTGSSVDVLSHSAVRARNGGVLFATCYEPTVLDKIGRNSKKAIKLSITADECVSFEEIDYSSLGRENSPASEANGSDAGRINIKAIDFAGEVAVGMDDFRENLVGAKARNTKALRDALTSGGIPGWINLPVSVAIPFGTFEHVLACPENAKQAKTMARLASEIDDSNGTSLAASLKVCRACVRSLIPPAGMLTRLADVMQRGGIEPPADDQTWDLAWRAICDVWASKWNDRAYVSMRNRGLDHNNLRMSVLVQPVINADHAFVIHTVNPSTGTEDELYAEVVQGMGETLVGNYPGRALSFTVKKSPEGAVSEPVIHGYPSKNTVLRVPCQTLIFRSDSNGEDLEGYAGAGLYESVPMHATVEYHADYASDALIWDRNARSDVLTAVARAGVAIERALGAAQDVEGVIRGGAVFVVQTRPQV
ncbi:Pyruvate phosphate dikinase,PEP/pyruvate-binding [Ostreococcus tauri]|uniref:Pyruvate phosphate dikinase,PEP/pyruvate-binding n=3 Tax=Ostreococcus tauri TaxID=70448 RepID=A0A090M894_OSTTA|nr:Pyruvate phosphate dikinase,PEP/pyruvate-binding [Ostreococcus tauri]CEG01373.1 Pyruvate phosphate dikinase,PEP/pyruvate-binding [Ostreococcus tauri]|eukprot:XP_022840916.1 Pyruvate phosphate dikinase,PEP/pyruvate-binding [Ostreococcus tauri]